MANGDVDNLPSSRVVMIVQRLSRPMRPRCLLEISNRSGPGGRGC